MKIMNLKYKRKNLVIFFFLAAVIFGIYHNSLHAPFVLDDMSKIVSNPDIRHIENIPSRLMYSYSEYKTDARNDPFRPITYLTYTINYHYGKLNPFVYRIFDVVIHVLNTFLIFVFVKKIFSKTDIPNKHAIAFISSVLFAVHPVNVNTVPYIFGRSGQLMAFFYLLGALVFIKSTEKFSFYPLVLLLYILSIFSKPDGITFPAVILSFDFFFMSDLKLKNVWNRKKHHIPLWCVAVIYILFRYFYLGEIGDYEGGVMRWERFEYMAIQPYVMFRYIMFLMYPAGISFEHHIEPLRGVLDIRLIFSVFSFSVAAFLIVLLLKKANPWKDSKKIVMFSVLFFLITVSPTSSFFPTTCPLAERYIYMPAIGFYVLMAFSIISFFKSRWFESLSFYVKRMFYGFVILYFFILVSGTYLRNDFYNDPIVLWEDVIERYPLHVRAGNNLGVIYKRKGDYLMALKKFYNVIRSDKGVSVARTYMNIGQVYYKYYGDSEKAKKYYMKAKSLAPGFAVVYNRLADIYRQREDYEKALEYNNRALKRDHLNTEAYNSIGIVYSIKEEYEKALKYYKRAAEINPSSLGVLNNTALAYMKLGEYEKAIEILERSLVLTKGHGKGDYTKNLMKLVKEKINEDSGNSR